MANQNIGTPRFIVDYIQYFHAKGLTKSNYATNNHYFWNAPSPYNDDTQETANIVSSLIGLNPISDFTFTGLSAATTDGYNHIVRMDKSFPVHQCNIVGLLGHNMATTGGDAGFSYHYYTDDSHWAQANLTDDFQVNATRSGTRFSVDYDGFSFCSCNGSNYPNEVWGNIEPNIRNVPNHTTATYKPGSLLWGRYYDMPHSPELSLTMAHEYDGIKKQETAGGSTLSYVNYYKPPDWGALQAWHLSGWDRKYSGRRVWDLSWNHLSDSDIEPFNYLTYSSLDGYTHNKYKDNFFTNVLHYTNGGQLPFIFCPDPSIPYVDFARMLPEFAICRFDMKTFKREQVANGVYNIKVKIKESW